MVIRLKFVEICIKKMTFFCIADNESSLGFKFAGIETREVKSRAEALEALQVALAIENVGIVVVTEKVSSLIRAELDDLLYKQELPLILEVPSRGELKKRKSTAESLKKIVGMSI